MRTMLLTLTTILIAADVACQWCQAGERAKIHDVGKDGLALQGKVESDDAKVNVLVDNKPLQLPAKLFLVKLSAGRKYRVSMDSIEIHSVVAVLSEADKQLAWDDDSGGGLNSLLTLDVLKDGAYKIYAASLKGAGSFTLTVRDDGAVKLYEVGRGLKINDQLSKTTAMIYNVRLDAGKAYVIDMMSPNQKALDPFLRLLDAEGKGLAMDDDGGEGMNARVIFQTVAAGAYQIVATSFGKGSGPFILTVREETKEAALKSAQIARAAKLNDEAVALYRAGKHQQAEPLLRQALEIRKEFLGEIHAHYATSLNNLAFLYESQGEYAKADPLYRQALEIRKEVLGEKHRDYAASLNNLAYLYESQGNYAKAEPLYRQALEIWKESLGEKHPDYAASLNNLASLYYSQGDYSKAELLYRQSLAICKEVLGEKHPKYATSLSNLAGLYQSQGHYAKAEPLYRQALESLKEALGEKHPNYATSLSNLARLFESQGDYAKAVLLCRQSLEIRKEVLGEKHPDYAISLNNLARLYMSQGNPGKAEPLYREALEIRKEMLGEKHPDYAESLNNLALLYNSLGSYAKAEPLYRQALAIWKEALGGKHRDYAASLNNLASLYDSQGSYSKAEQLYRQSLAIWEKVLGKKHRDYASGLNNLAGLYNSQGNSASAELLYREALEIQKEVLGEKHADYASSLNNLAGLYKSQAHYARAEAMYRQALEIWKQVMGAKHHGYASSLNDLADLYKSRGDSAKAEPLYRQALEIRKEVLGEKHRDFASTLNNLALLYHSQGNYAKAEPLYRQALKIWKEALGEKHRDYASVLNNMALLYKSQANFAKAEPFYRQALETHKEVLGEKHHDYATNLNNLAGLYESQGDYAKAEPLYLQALEIWKDVLGVKHPIYALSLNNLASLYDSQGTYAKAEPYFRQALVASQVANNPVPFEKLQIDDFRIHPLTVLILENYARRTRKLATSDLDSESLRLSDRSFLFGLSVLDRVRQDALDHEESKIQLTAERFDMVPDRIEVLSQLFSLEKNSQELEAAFWTAEQGTARAFLESLGKSRANVLASINPKHQTEETLLLQDIRTLDLRLDKESAKALAQRNPDLIGQFFSERREAEGKLKQLIGELEKDYPQYAGFKYPRPCNLDEARASLAPDEISLLFVLGTKASFIVLVEARPNPGDSTNGLAIFELPSSARITDAVAALIDPETLALPRAKTLARAVFEMLLGPCKDRIKNKNLVIVPNGSLCFLPFEFLVEEDGKYLVEKHRIRYAPSLTALHLINLWKQKRAASEVPLFAVGDPLYEKEFQRLEHSGYEVAEIAKVLNAKDEFVLTRGKASKGDVKKLSEANTIAKARYVHFATHGILGLDRGKQPALVLNQTGPDAEECFLQMDEITGLKLNADLVVLSACKSGQGKLHQGEGVTGLARAFLYAGSKGVVCSLWSVDDRETANLMIDFYGHLQKGRSAPDALRDAQLAMIRAGKAPLYWAPFIVIGE